MVVTGVRWAESARRKALHGVADIQTESKKLHKEAMETNATATKVNKNGGLVFMDDNAESRRMVEHCYAKRKTTVNPIVDWEDEDVWEFLNEVAKVPHCCLYDEGFTRLGCVGCPLQGRAGMLRDFERWPRYKELYIRAFDKMIQNHPGEIKVASGELAETNGGVQRYTQDGSHGTPDGDGSGHATCEQAEPRDQPKELQMHRTLKDWDEPNHIQRGPIPDVLAVAVSGEPSRRGTKAFNPDPRIADYESGESLFLAWVGGVPYPGSTETKIMRK